MPQPLKSGIDGHQSGHHLHTVMAAPATGIHPTRYLVQVVPHSGKLAQQRRRKCGKFAGAGGLLVQARLAYPRRELFAVAAFQQSPVLVFSHPQGEHFGAFLGQSGLLITPGRAGNLFPVGVALDKPQARQWLLAGFGAQP